MKNVLTVLFSLGLMSCSQFSEPQGLGSPVVQKVSANQIEEPLEATFSSIKLNIINKKCIGCHNAKSPDKKAAEIPFSRESEVLKGSSGLGDLVVPGEPNKSLFYRVMVKDDKIRGKAKAMPPSGSTHEPVNEEELQVVAAWITGVAVKSEIAGQEPATNKPNPGTCPVVPGTPGTVPPVVPTEPVVVEPAVIDFAFIKTQILEKKCVNCHKSGGKADELVFGDRQSLLSLSNSYGQEMVVPGKAIQSLIYLALLKDESVRQDTRLMPPKKEVDAGKVKDITEVETEWIKKWIDQGAK